MRKKGMLLSSGETKQEFTERLRREGYWSKMDDGWQLKDEMFYRKFLEGCTRTESARYAWEFLLKKHPLKNPDEPRPAPHPEMDDPVAPTVSPNAPPVSCPACHYAMSLNDCPRVAFACPACGQTLRVREKSVDIVELVAVSNQVEE